jgi:hypothetical protein
MRLERSIIAWNTSATLGSIRSAMTSSHGWFSAAGADEQHGRGVHAARSKPNAQRGICKHGPNLLIGDEVRASAGPDRDLHARSV